MLLSGLLKQITRRKFGTESEAAASTLLTFGAPPNIGCRRVMVSVGGGKELVCHRQIALVPKFFKQTTDDSCGHRNDYGSFAPREHPVHEDRLPTQLGRAFEEFLTKSSLTGERLMLK